jgi:hypothetical protein
MSLCTLEMTSRTKGYLQHIAFALGQMLLLTI